MIIKNISGETRYFGFGTKARGRTLANNATGTLPDEPSVIELVQHYVGQGLLQIVGGPAEAALLGGGTTPASGFLLITGAVSDNDTVTIAGEVFKFANAPTSPALGTYYTSLSARWAGDGAAASVASGTLVDAINAVAALNVTADPAVAYASGKYIVALRAKNGTKVATGLTLAETGTNIAKSAGTFDAGADQAARRTLVLKRVVTSTDVTNTVIAINTGLPSLSFWVVQLRSAAGASIAWTGKVSSTGGTLLLALDGLTDFADTDVFNIIVAE